MARGLPQYVTCRECGGPKGWPTHGLCRKCSGGRRRYVWTAERDRLVREAWRLGTTKPRLTEAISFAVRQIGFPRHIVRFRAAFLGLCQDTRGPWTREEREFVGEHAGTRTAKWMGKHLKRSTQSVQSFMNYSSISRRVLEGYSLQEVVALMGVSFPTAQRWLQLGLVTARDGRVTEESLRLFVFRHPELYTLRKVDEHWFKPLVFASAAVYRGRREIAQKGFVPPAAMPVSSVKQEVAEFQSGASA